MTVCECFFGDCTCPVRRKGTPVSQVTTPWTRQAVLNIICPTDRHGSIDLGTGGRAENAKCSVCKREAVLPAKRYWKNFT